MSGLYEVGRMNFFSKGILKRKAGRGEGGWRGRREWREGGRGQEITQEHWGGIHRGRQRYCLTEARGRFNKHQTEDMELASFQALCQVLNTNGHQDRVLVLKSLSLLVEKNCRERQPDLALFSFMFQLHHEHQVQVLQQERWKVSVEEDPGLRTHMANCTTATAQVEGAKKVSMQV